MKKSILFPALALSVGLFSCSQEDLSGNASQSDQPVTVTVQLPDDVAGRVSSRYIPSASDDAHQLRCILYVTNSDGSWSERIEKVESEAVGEPSALPLLRRMRTTINVRSGQTSLKMMLPLREMATKRNMPTCIITHRACLQ